MSRTAIVVFSDPKAGHEEALGRLFNAMFLALEPKEKGQDPDLIFQGPGARWPAEATEPTHPAHALYPAIADKAVGACADAFGASQAASATGLPLARDEQVPGTHGILDLSRYLDQGYRLVAF